MKRFQFHKFDDEKIVISDRFMLYNSPCHNNDIMFDNCEKSSYIPINIPNFWGKSNKKSVLFSNFILPNLIDSPYSILSQS
jgi:hypothetical protein